MLQGLMATLTSNADHEGRRIGGVLASDVFLVHPWPVAVQALGNDPSHHGKNINIPFNYNL